MFECLVSGNKLRFIKVEKIQPGINIGEQNGLKTEAAFLTKAMKKNTFTFRFPENAGYYENAELVKDLKWEKVNVMLTSGFLVEDMFSQRKLVKNMQNPFYTWQNVLKNMKFFVSDHFTIDNVINTLMNGFFFVACICELYTYRTEDTSQ